MSPSPSLQSKLPTTLELTLLRSSFPTTLVLSSLLTCTTQCRATSTCTPVILMVRPNFFRLLLRQALTCNVSQPKEASIHSPCSLLMVRRSLGAVTAELLVMETLMLLLPTGSAPAENSKTLGGCKLRFIKHKFPCLQNFSVTHGKLPLHPDRNSEFCLKSGFSWLSSVPLWPK